MERIIYSNRMTLSVQSERKGSVLFDLFEKCRVRGFIKHMGYGLEFWFFECFYKHRRYSQAHQWAEFLFPSGQLKSIIQDIKN